MTFTSHGHHIHGTILAVRPESHQVARCGGPGLCQKCGAEAYQILNLKLGIPSGNEYEFSKVKEDEPMLEITTHRRKSFDVQAVQVTEDNFTKVADWCRGQIITPPVQQMALDGLESTEPPTRYILILVHRPVTPRQGHAYVGDWVLKTTKGFKVYTDVAFKKNFDPAVTTS